MEDPFELIFPNAGLKAALATIVCLFFLQNPWNIWTPNKKQLQFFKQEFLI